MELDLQSLIWAPLYSYTNQLRPCNSPPPSPRIWDLYTRALLVSQDRSHLYVTPWEPTSSENLLYQLSNSSYRDWVTRRNSNILTKMDTSRSKLEPLPYPCVVAQLLRLFGKCILPLVFHMSTSCGYHTRDTAPIRSLFHHFIDSTENPLEYLCRTRNATEKRICREQALS